MFFHYPLNCSQETEMTSTRCWSIEFEIAYRRLLQEFQQLTTGHLNEIRYNGYAWLSRKYNKHARVLDSIHGRVIFNRFVSPHWWFEHALLTHFVVPGQNQTLEHVLCSSFVSWRICVVGWVTEISRKVRPFAIRCCWIKSLNEVVQTLWSQKK